MNRVFASSVLSVGWLCGLAATFASAQLVPTPPPPVGNLFFDYFLFDNAGQPANGFGNPAQPLLQYLQWTVTDGTTDLLGGTVPGADDLPDGRYVDLGGSTNDPGLMQSRTAFPFTPGLTYNLFFQYRSVDGLPASATVSVAGKTFTASSSSTDFVDFSQNFTVTSAITTPIAFQDLGNDNSGLGIDAVLLSVPEPTSLGVCAGVAVLALRRRARTLTSPMPR